MAISRLDNFLRSVRGTTLHVNPNSLDSTDSISNTGSSPARPFKTIQRAIAEAVRYSYQRGSNNDRFDRTTILIYPGEHIVDNRPGYIANSNGTFTTRGGSTVTDFVEWDTTTSFELEDPDNALYKLNSIYGGVILPRGVSLVGQDLRKTIIRPLYVPNPVNENIEASTIFRVTGGCFIYGFTVFDSDPNGLCYKDYTKNLFVPNFSHHKLRCFEFADGVNSVSINDDFLTYSTTRTDLEIFYEKIGLAYGQSSGREIPNDYPSASLDIEPVVDEFRIVGSRGKQIGITSIFSGDGVTSSNIITVNLAEEVVDISTDTPIQIQGVQSTGYNGNYVVIAIPSNTSIQYRVQSPPENPFPAVVGGTLNIVVDTVTSASPYIFNCSLRSVYGMCGMLADGSKASGFRSMVVAQFTAIGLQKDENAFVKYDQDNGIYLDSTEVANLGSDTRAIYKPEYENFHIKATNDAFLQLVSIFSIGFANHFVAENGGDFSITNSNSNFGSKALVSKGYRTDAFDRDNLGYITHFIPPREISSTEKNIEFLPIDVSKTVSVGQTNRLYLYGYQTTGDIPNHIIDGYRIGAREGDELFVKINQNGVTNTYSAKIVMPNTQYTSRTSSQKSFTVGTNVSGINSIGASGTNIIDLTTAHTFVTGEKVKVISENGSLPDGILPNQSYYIIASDVDGGLTSTQIKLAQSKSNAINTTGININNNGRKLSIVSKVIDKVGGDYGHPLQKDGATSGWYINVSGIGTENTIYSTIVGLGTTSLGDATPRTYIRRRQDNRTLNDKIYKVRYVIPKDSPISGRPPLEGYVIQDASSGIGTGTNEIQKYFATSATLTNSTELRKLNFISEASWSSNTVTITTELPHELSIGSEVKIENIVPDGYNGTYTVTNILSSRKFTYSLSTNPGVFSSDISTRNSDLPRFTRKKYNDTYYVYKSEEIQPYVPNSQDGVYHLTVLNASNSPTVAPFTDYKFSQPIQNLYPQLNRDNPNSNPKATKSFALPSPVGQVIVNDSEGSITRETVEKHLSDRYVGAGITNIVSSNANNHVIYTKYDHSFSGIGSVSITSAGSNYIEGEYFGADLIGGTGSSASAKITVNASGNVSAVNIMHQGGGYVIGDTLTVSLPVGIGTTTGFTAATVQVSSVRNSSNDVISVYGISDSRYESYNNNYRITSVSGPKTINVVSTSPISGFAVSGIGVTASSNSSYLNVGPIVPVSTISYNSTDGTATIGFSTSHGFRINNKIILSGADNNFFNGEFIVSNVTNVTTATINTGFSTETSPSTSGTIFAHRSALNSSEGEEYTGENLSGRFSFEYAGITTVTGSVLSFNALENTTITIPNAVSLGLKLGDFLLIDDEIFRIRSTVSGNNISVFRSLFGTSRQTHAINSVVRTIKVLPIELRRNSIIRASAHTFEYLGFGPGNYSSSLPEKQDRILSPAEELLSQSTRVDGGAIVFSGMNSDGDFYTANKVIKASTGQEEVYNSPIPSVSGEEGENANITSELISSTDLVVFRSLKVEGGSDKQLISEFSGPIIFNNKVSSNNEIEAKDLYIQGTEEVSRKFSVSTEKPTTAGNYGDVIFNAEPVEDGDTGWIYTITNEWQSLGSVGENKVGVSTGLFNSYVGLATQLNFVGYGLSVLGTFNNVTGIATVSVDASEILSAISGIGSALVGIGSTLSNLTINNPGIPNYSIQFNNGGTQFGGVPSFIYNDTTNTLLLSGASDQALLNINQSGSGYALIVEDVYIPGTGYVGLGSTAPTAKLDILALSQQALKIRSTSGSGNIISIENEANDTQPIIFDVQGNLGINTTSASEKLSVYGNVAVTGIIRSVDPTTSQYVGFQAPVLGANFTYTLPNSYGTNGQVLVTDGSGGLSWTNNVGFTSSNVIAGTGITISYATVEGQPQATINNSGVNSIVAGTGVSVTNSGVGTVTISVSDLTVTAAPYPFTTPGFGMPI